MSEFKKLKNGDYVYVTNFDGNKKVIEGYSFKSFGLEKRHFSFASIDQEWVMDTHEVSVALKMIDRTKYPKTYTHEDINLLEIRVREINTRILQIENKKKRALEFIHRH